MGQTINLVDVTYGQTGKSTQNNALGMRDMQARAFEKRDSQYLLLKAPPASGKSRALMFLALDKLHRQGMQKAIIAVPEMSIGGSFNNTDLMKHGFYANWEIKERNNLCISGDNQGKVDRFVEFMRGDDEILLCTHATLRFAFERLTPEDFNNTLLAIDEFHHVSAEEENRLGSLIDQVMTDSNAHIIAMTGSYFRGDAVPILEPEAEAKFTKVTYTYYEQLNGYTYLKTLGIGYHFYQGRYLEALKEILDTTKKTLIHIPNVNSLESTGNKYTEVGHIHDIIGEVVEQDPENHILTLKRHSDGKLLKVADLVDDSKERPKVMEYLRNVDTRDGIDIIIALGMAKEGFDWPWCEHALTIGFRSSLTEIVQIIGRATRDCEGKSHAQFTNLIAQPDADDTDVAVSVNTMLKAISASLLMEQILKPNITFRPRSTIQVGEKLPAGTIIVDDHTKAPSEQVLEILNGGSDDIFAALMQDEKAQASYFSDQGMIETEVVNTFMIPKIIRTLHPDLNDEEVDQLHQGLLTNLFIRQEGGVVNEADLPEDAIIDGGFIKEAGSISGSGHGTTTDEGGGSRQFVKMEGRFIDIADLNVDLIASVNPFQGAYEILSKNIDAPLLKTLQTALSARRISMSEEEAVMLWPRINQFIAEHGREPDLHSNDNIERRYAEGLTYIRRKYAERQAGDVK